MRAFIGMAALLVGIAVGLTATPRPALARLRAVGEAVPQDTTCPAEEFLPWSSSPSFTPYTTPPELKNRGDALEAIRREYPKRLRDAGIGGVTVVWLFVDRCGQVRNVWLRSSSGLPALDSAATRVIRLMRFTPALRGRTPVSVWISVPVVFGNARYVPERTAGMSDTLQVPARLRSDVLPTFPAPAGMRGPSLLNAGAVEARLLEGYAPLRARGVAGVAVLAVHLGPDGRLIRAAVARTSGSAALDSLALGTAYAMAFTPAVDADNRYSSISTTVPIRFGPPTK